MNINVSTGNMKFFEAISSQTRIRMIELLNIKPLNVKELANILELSSPIVTRHVQQLEEAGILRCESSPGVRGMQKICHINIEQAILCFKTKNETDSAYIHSIPVGQYHAYSVNPTCGLSSREKLIGMLDDPRYFADPEHTNAAIIWFGSGWVEYRVPNYLLNNQELLYITVMLEICSEFPGYNDEWPSDISFHINNIKIGSWTSPGDFGKIKGVFTPDWWNHGTQHGLLKTLLVNAKGSYMDGVKISDVKIDDLDIAYNKDIFFKLSNTKDSHNVGGISVFGKGFGNYNQDINVTIGYKSR